MDLLLEVRKVVVEVVGLWRGTRVQDQFYSKMAATSWFRRSSGCPYYCSVQADTPKYSVIPAEEERMTVSQDSSAVGSSASLSDGKDMKELELDFQRVHVSGEDHSGVSQIGV